MTAGPNEINLLFMDIQHMEKQIINYKKKLKDLDEKRAAYELIMLSLKEPKEETK